MKHNFWLIMSLMMAFAALWAGFLVWIFSTAPEAAKFLIEVFDALPWMYQGAIAVFWMAVVWGGFTSTRG